MNNSAIDSFLVTTGLSGGPGSASTRVEVDFLISELGIQPGQRLLDAPCGNGRHARLFGERGIRVTAVDSDSASLAAAMRDCAHPAIEYHQMDVRSVSELGLQFDAISSVFSCIGYFDDPADDEKFLCAFASVLKDRGRIVLSTANGTVVGRAGETRAAFEPGNLKIERIDRYDPLRGTLYRRFDILDTKSGGRTSIEHRRRLYSPEEATQLLSRCGIALIRMMGDYRGGEFDPEKSPHAIYLGELLR